MKKNTYHLQSAILVSLCGLCGCKNTLDVGTVPADAGAVDGAAGVTSTGAGTGVGGSIAKGGAMGTGGVTDTGGIADMGGGMGTGGVVGTGGETGIGGATGNGGVTGACGRQSIADLLQVFAGLSVLDWHVDDSVTPTSKGVAAIATSEVATENLIDGAAADLFAVSHAPLAFGWQNYINPKLSSPYGNSPNTGSELKLYVLQMASAQDAAALYASLPSASLYSAGGTVWAQPTISIVGDDSRMTNSGGDWWINFRKCNYYVEVRMTPSYGPAPDFVENDPTQKAATINFALAVASRL